MAGYTRQSTFADGDTITATLFNNEYNQLLNVFSNTGGHKHDGTAAEGPVIGLIGDAGVVTPLNKVLIDSTNDHIEFWIDVSSSSVQQLYIADGAIVPVTDNDIDLGTSSLQFKDLYINGTANIDSLVLATGSTVTAVLDEDDLSSDSATSLVTQQSVKAYIDAQVTAQDLDFLGDSGGALSIDLDSESLTIAGGTGLDTVGSGNTVTVNIDATVATLTGSQTLTNKTIDVDNNTVSNIEVDNFKASAIVLESEGIGSNDNDTSLPTSAAVKDYVDTQITAEDLDITTDSGTIAIDLDSETLTVSGGTGLDSSATGNAVTLAIDSTVTTLTGTQTLTNKTLTSPDVNIPDIDGGTIDGATIATSDVTVGAGKTLDVSAGTLTLADNQISGDKVEGGTIAATTITDLTFGSLNDGTITATAFVDEDNMASNSATLIPTQQSVKAYVDTTVAATNEVVEDTTPQLGGDLDLNSSDITGTGNINITGTIQSSGNITGTLATAAQPNITSVGTLTGFTSTGIDDNASSTTITIDSSNRVNIGKTSSVSGKPLEVQANTSGQSLGLYGRASDGLSYLGFFANGANTEYASLRADNTSSLSVRTGGSERLKIDSTGIDVTGTATMDGLTVDGTGTFNNNANENLFIADTANTSRSSLQISGSTTFFNGNIDSASHGLFVWRSSNAYTERMRIDSSGRVGIGTTSPTFKLDVAGNARASYFALRTNESAPAETSFIYRPATGTLAFGTASTEKMRIDSSGNVGIGGTPTTKLYVEGASPTARLYSSTTTGGTLDFVDQSWQSQIQGNAGSLLFKTGGSSERMRIDSSGRVGIGTSSPASTISGSAAVLHLYDGTNNNLASLALQAGTVGSKWEIGALSSNALGFFDDGSERVRIDSSGNVGIGTGNPTYKLVLRDDSTSAYPLSLENNNIGTAGVHTGIRFGYAGGSYQKGAIIFESQDANGRGKMYFAMEGAANSSNADETDAKMTIDYSGNVGIGTTSPSAKLAIVGTTKVGEGAGSNGAKLMVNTQSGVAAGIQLFQDGVESWIIQNPASTTALTFANSGSEKMRLDSSGNLLVGTTDSNVTNNSGDATRAGINIGVAGIKGYIAAARYQGAPLALNRLDNDGDIIAFAKDGTTVGNIVSRAGLVSSIVLDPRASGSGLTGTSDAILPTEQTGTPTNNNIDLGNSTLRFKDIYLGGGAYLGGTGAANHLDDYEEGTFTPLLSGSGYAFGTHSGAYVKVGRMVTVTAVMVITSVGSNTSVIGITGYPFTSYSANNNHQVGNVRESATTGKFYVCQINYNNTIGSLNSMDGISSGSNEIFTTGTYSLSMTYMTS